jgi:hypothetical protein
MIIIVFLSFFVLNLFLAVISDSFEQVNQNELQEERKQDSVKQELLTKFAPLLSPKMLYDQCKAN